MFKAKKTFDNEKRDPAVRETFLAGRGGVKNSRLDMGFHWEE